MVAKALVSDKISVIMYKRKRKPAQSVVRSTQARSGVYVQRFRAFETGNGTWARVVLRLVLRFLLIENPISTTNTFIVRSFKTN